MATEKEMFEQASALLKAGDYAGAFQLLLPLAQQGAASAQYNLGVLYGKGQGTEKNMREAFKWLARGRPEPRRRREVFGRHGG